MGSAPVSIPRSHRVVRSQADVISEKPVLAGWFLQLVAQEDRYRFSRASTLPGETQLSAPTMALFLYRLARYSIILGGALIL